MRFLLVLVPLALTAASLPSAPQGRALFRSNCAFCHGLDARGGRGPNLVSAPLVHGDTDAALKKVIKNGVPGTSMPAFDSFGNGELASLVAFIRSLSAKTTRSTPVLGSAAHGKAVYAASGCAGCHAIGKEGSVFGPDLTRAGAARSVEYLRQSIVDPSADVPEEWQGVTVVDKTGRKVSGIRINEDTFTIQLRDVSQKFRMYDKDDLREVTYEKKSLMPAYAQLSPADLNDLLAYLVTLRGANAQSGAAAKATGIR